MERDPDKWLEDIITNGRDALEFLEGKSQEDYISDKGLRAMVERKLFVVGEAVRQLRGTSPEIDGKLPETREIVGFRNLLAHAYFALDHRRVYDIATISLPALLQAAQELIGE